MSKIGQAGTLESNDIHIVISEAAAGTGIRITLTSTVLAQYDDAIKGAIEGVCRDMGVHDATITAADKGALECTIKARTQTAVERMGIR